MQPNSKLWRYDKTLQVTCKPSQVIMFRGKNTMLLAFLIEPAHDKTYNKICVTSKD